MDITTDAAFEAEHYIDGVVDAPPAAPDTPEAPVEAEPAGDGLTEEPAAPRKRDEQGRFVAAEPATEEPEQGASEEPATETTEEPQRRGKPRDDPQARIDQAIGRQREAERRAEALEARLRALETKAAPTVQAPAVEDPEPDPNDTKKYPNGDYDRAFLRDQARWEARQEFKAQQKIADEQRAKEQREQSYSQHAASLQQRLAADPEGLARVSPAVLAVRPSWALEGNEKATADTAIADGIDRSKHPLKVMLHLSEHPAEFQRLSTLHPVEVMWEMGRLEERLGAAVTGTASPRVISQARPPVSPVSGAPQVAGVEYSDDQSFESFMAQEERREKRRRA